MGVFKDYEKAVWDVEHNNCTLGELEAAEQRLKDSIVEWHPYPKEKPKENESYLVTYEGYITGNSYVNISRYFWDGFVHRRVIAWAELPKPYEEGAE